MSWKSLFFVAWFYILLPHVASSDLVVRNLPGKTPDETIHEVRRRLARRVKRAGTNVLFDNSTSFSLGLDGVTIFKYPFDDSSDGGVSASIAIICTKCYMKGQASAKVTANGSFNLSSAFDQAQDSFENTWHSITAYAKNVTEKIASDIPLHADHLFDDFENITAPDIDFNLDLRFPDYSVDVNLTDVEIYMEIDTVLSAGITYTFNLYQSKTIVGVALGDDLLLGAVFSVDLIFSVNGQIDIQSGFHVHFDNVRTQIVLFGKEASKLNFDGGKFAFLPVTVQSGGVVLKAVLRLEARIGISFDTFVSLLDIQALDVLDVGAGVEARIYANIAEFVTNMTLGEVDSPKKRDDDCLLSIAQAYTFGVGAAAGASLVIFGNTWGPMPETEIPVFYTTLATACAKTRATSATTVTATTATAASSRSSAPGKRAESLSVTSTVTSETQIATVCASSGLINCPASLQSMTKNVITKTLTSTITSGVPVVWSAAPPSSFKTVDFQADAVTMTSSAGKPKSYAPPPSTTSLAPTASATDAVSAQERPGNHRVSNAVIIGVSVGLGVPVLLAAIGAFIYFFRRNRRIASTLVPTATHTVATKAQPVVATYTSVRPEDD
ncbi:hypothetical protein V8C37DRAFT_385411 [Trichoderma ceciliae]